MTRSSKKAAIGVSPSGYYKVTISRAWPHEGFTYLPSHDITADQAVVDAMAADDVIEHVEHA
jgi:hypothetical protein